MSESEIEELRKYIWNKNDADLILYYPNYTDKLKLFYAKNSPTISNKKSLLETFSTSQKELEKIDNIMHWQFDSGAFWLNYQKFFKNAKYKGIDKELVNTLQVLKAQLDNTLLNLITDESERNEVVQAIIDRTLYIKYLEDSHIINSHFYGYYFNDNTLNYKKLLEQNSDTDLNKLFKKIHEIFNNYLFESPTINNKYLTKEVRELIASSFNTNLNTGQLKLFHFQFDILPVEFISYIYEVFLSDKQKKNGIYYTPKKLAQLIVDEVVNEDKIGSILDPSSGSGMFLIVGYQKLLEIARKQGLEPIDSLEKIKFRIELLVNNIFGIEKEPTAQRFTLFSLSLQIFKGIKAEVIRDFIASELEQNKMINLFSGFSFFENIKCANTLDTTHRPFADRKFLYIIGNPPFFEIPDNHDYTKEISFLKSYKVTSDKKEITIAKDIVGNSQISQCFFIKIKDWADIDTRFGFVSNSSNFYNDKSEKFQNFFYSNYGIEKIYELSRVKKILFEKAKESVLALIFNNESTGDIIDYYPVELGLFSEKPFELLIIQEDKAIPIEKKKLIEKEITLRDFLIGNEYDRELLINLSYQDTLKSYLSSNKNFSSFRGLTRLTNQDLLKHYKIEKVSDSKELIYLHKKYEKEKYLSNYKTEKYDTPYLYKPEGRLLSFTLKGVDGFVNKKDINKENFQRIRDTFIYEGKKILINKFGNKIQAVFYNDDLFFSNLIYSIKLENSDLYYLITAIINSNLVNYYIAQKYRSRTGDNFTNVNTATIKEIPIPREFDLDLIKNISDISQELTRGDYEYPLKEKELNELIYDFYELSYWEKRRIEDYFLANKNSRIGRRKNALSDYISTLTELLNFYFKNSVTTEEASTDFGLKVVKISLNHSNSPKPHHLRRFILNEIFKQNPNENFLAGKEKIFGEDCVYIVKEDFNKNWTETKAFEDGRDILKRINIR